jgi:hypothetical protein
MMERANEGDGARPRPQPNDYFNNVTASGAVESSRKLLKDDVDVRRAERAEDVVL